MVSCPDKQQWIGELEGRLEGLLSLPPKTDVEHNRAIESVTESLDILQRYQCGPPKFALPEYGQAARGERDGPTVLDFLVDEFVQPGGIVLEGYPPKLPCRCVTFEGKDLCTRKGVIGTLSQEQNKELCSSMEHEADHRLARLQAFRACVDEIHPKLASIPHGRERLLYWITHMGECLRGLGVELR